MGIGGLGERGEFAPLSPSRLPFFGGSGGLSFAKERPPPCLQKSPIPMIVSPAGVAVHTHLTRRPTPACRHFHSVRGRNAPALPLLASRRHNQWILACRWVARSQCWRELDHASVEADGLDVASKA